MGGVLVHRFVGRFVAILGELFFGNGLPSDSPGRCVDVVGGLGFDVQELSEVLFCLTRCHAVAGGTEGSGFDWVVQCGSWWFCCGRQPTCGFAIDPDVDVGSEAREANEIQRFELVAAFGYVVRIVC